MTTPASARITPIICFMTKSPRARQAWHAKRPEVVSGLLFDQPGDGYLRDRRVRVSRENPNAVRRNRERLDGRVELAECKHPARQDVPDPEGLIVAGTQEEAPVGRECDCPHRVGVPVEFDRLLSGREVPEEDRPGNSAPGE